MFANAQGEWRISQNIKSVVTKMGFAKGEAMPTRKIGRDAKTGRIIPVKEAQRRKRTAVVETVKTPKRKGPKG